MDARDEIGHRDDHSIPSEMDGLTDGQGDPELYKCRDALHQKSVTCRQKETCIVVCVTQNR